MVQEKILLARLSGYTETNHLGQGEDKLVRTNRGGTGEQGSSKSASVEHVI